jgi:hypothetical protein
MPDFIGSADPTAAYAIKTDDLAALHEAVVALDTSV